MFSVVNNTLISAAVLLFCMTAQAQANFSGKAYDLKTNDLVYTEHHTYSETDQGKQMQSQYLDPQGNEIASRQVIYADQQVSHYQLDQKSIGYSESITRDNNQIILSVESNTNTNKQSNETSYIDNSKDIIIDAGFSDYIKRNWDELLSGETRKFKFSSASRMNTVGLQVRLKETNDENVIFTMTASNPIIRLLLTPILIGYSSATKDLSYYKGISNIKDNDGKNVDVEIFYETQAN